MTSFAADWLALREPFDGAARNPDVLAVVGASFAGLHSIMVTDLACGTGSTLRAISSRLPPRQTWRLADNNLSLLGRAASAPLASGIIVNPMPVDLAHDLEAALDGPTDLVTTSAPLASGIIVNPMPVDLAHDLEAALDGPTDLVTTSALLDLVSPEWLERFVVETAARRVPVYAALTYDGRVNFEPGDRLDAAVIGAVNRHQRRDKGFGPALGPTAAAMAITRFENAGYSVVQGKSNWAFGPLDQEIQNEVVAGWAAAGREAGDLALSDIVDWLTRRRDLIAAGRSRMRVGHVDFFARPTSTL